MKVEAKLKGKPKSGRDIRIEVDKLILEAGDDFDKHALSAIYQAIVLNKFPELSRAIIDSAETLKP